MFTVITNLMCMQILVITSTAVHHAKQGTCTLHDAEPPPPTLAGLDDPEGWKLVRNIIVNRGGADYVFPKDQILLKVRGEAMYKVIEKAKDRELGALRKQKQYLVWYDHLMTEEDWKRKTKKR
jgi:hypothetical protein